MLYNSPMKAKYLVPTHIIMGDDCLFENRGLFTELGKKALIITGRNSAKKNGSYADTVKALEANGQGHVLYDGVMSNPTDICVFEAADAARAGGCDFVIALGGGSPMDAAKAAAILAVNDISKEGLFGLSFKTALPLIAVPTTAGTGSEATPYSVLVDTAGPVKRSVGSPLLFPRFAFLDARYMKGLGRDTTVNTAIDALSHAVEGMCSVRSDFISDTLAKESIVMIMSCFDALLDFPSQPEKLPVEIREKLLLASAMAGMVIAQTGTMVVHSMGYQFTLNWGTDHGRANGLIIGAFLKLLEAREKADPSIQRRIVSICAALGMDLDEFSRKLDRLLGKREKATSAQLEEWADKSNEPRKLTNCYIIVDRKEIFEMFRQSAG